MRKAEVKKERFYMTNNETVVQCVDLGEGRFPRIPKFKTIFPIAGQERLLEARELRREVSPREVAALKVA